MVSGDLHKGFIGAEGEGGLGSESPRKLFTVVALAAFYARITVDLPRRTIQLLGSAMAVTALVKVAMSDFDPRAAVLMVVVGCHLVRHPLDGVSVLELLAEYMRRRWGEPPEPPTPDARM